MTICGHTVDWWCADFSVDIFVDCEEAIYPTFVVIGVEYISGPISKQIEIQLAKIYGGTIYVSYVCVACTKAVWNIMYILEYAMFLNRTIYNTIQNVVAEWMLGLLCTPSEVHVERYIICDFQVRIIKISTYIIAKPNGNYSR